MTLARHIMVAATYDKAGEAAIAEALDFAASTPGADLHVVHVLPGDDALARRAPDAVDEKLRDALQKLHAFVEPLASRAGVAPRVKLHIRLGDAPEAIHQACVDYDVDFVVVGTHARTGLQRAVLGSVADKLIRIARLPVVVARPKDFAGLTRTPGVEPPRAGGADDVRDAHVSGSTALHHPTHISGLL